ncbi:helix-turn-helix domain-containing protein [Halomonas coralii]|uniref:helix-turn-helix domain-containing protein n=1 Tax=Modicisalibacter sp. R2A 31.J TaxID=2831898 RepID=UPI001D48C291|nr:helix-turn-helix domain-containing protein [Modicisalibacter sp. R2A 31.J]MBZ9557331.1 helix-turn-helix domain-containing protein [Modicisalibacter sp. R2A 31.J]
MTESFADRWIRDYEAKHPEKAKARYTTSSPLGSPLPSPACPPRPRAVPTSALSSPRSGEPWHAQTSSPTPRPTIPPASQNVQAVVQAAIALRRDGGLTQEEFACRLGINVRTWQEWEQGRRLPSGPAKTLLERGLKELDRGDLA